MNKMKKKQDMRILKIPEYCPRKRDGNKHQRIRIAIKLKK
jgi:hypothetical protein